MTEPRTLRPVLATAHTTSVTRNSVATENSLSRHTCLVAKKKKKDPRDLRRHGFPKIQHEIQLYFRKTPLKVCFQPHVNFPKNLHALNDVGRTSYYLLSPFLSSHLFLFLLSPPYLTTLTPIHPISKLLSQPNHNPPKSPSSHQQAIFP